MNVIIGKGAANQTIGTDITAVGTNALTIATGAGNSAFGFGAGSTITTGARGTFIGYGANAGAAHNDVISVGYNAVATRSKEIAIGTVSQEFLQLFGVSFARYKPVLDNVWLGDDGPPTDPTGQYNFGLGRVALNSITSGNANLAIGFSALQLQKTGTNTIAIGVVAGQYAASVADTILIGVKTGRFMTSGVGATAVGFRALEHNASARNNTALGDSALWHTQGEANVALGYVVAEGMSKGDRNIAIGRGTMRYRDDGNDNVFIGELAGSIISNSLPGQPGENIGVGDAAPSANIGGAAAGHRNVGVGIESLGDCLGSDVTALGYRSGRSAVGTTAASLNSTFIGANAGNNPEQKVDAVNSTALGANAYTTADNQVAIGDANIEEFVFGGIRVPKAAMQPYLSKSVRSSETPLVITAAADEYMAFQFLVTSLDFDLFPATHFRLIVRGNSSEDGETVTFQVDQDETGTGNPISATGDDLVLPYNGGSAAFVDSGWIEIADALTGLQNFFIRAKRSNATAGAQMFDMQIEWKIDLSEPAPPPE